ncbi:hypothetical protein ACKWTF_016510 [Chironomus riparius]
MANFKPFISNTNDVEDVDVYIDVKRISTSLLGFVHFTSTFLEISDVIVATPGERYSSYEKLWLPFDGTTWILLILTFLMAFIGIFVINRMPIFMQQRVYGEKNQTPAINVISAFFGLAHYKLPMRHIPRFILIMFIFFCLIFRTCYQSKLFDFMTSEPRRPPQKSILDLKDKGYKVLSHLPEEFLTSLLEDDESVWPPV